MGEDLAHSVFEVEQICCDLELTNGGCEEVGFVMFGPMVRSNWCFENHKFPR
jgi:hypothetical protein